MDDITCHHAGGSAVAGRIRKKWRFCVETLAFCRQTSKKKLSVLKPLGSRKFSEVPKPPKVKLVTVKTIVLYANVLFSFCSCKLRSKSTHLNKGQSFFFKVRNELLIFFLVFRFYQFKKKFSEVTVLGGVNVLVERPRGQKQAKFTNFNKKYLFLYYKKD